MAENKQDELVRAYATLSALRKNIDQMACNSVAEAYVHLFNEALDRIEGIGVNISEFCIPESGITPRVTSIRTLTYGDKPAGPEYSKEKYVDKTLILTKLDAILGYLETITSEKPRKMGYI